MQQSKKHSATGKRSTHLGKKEEPKRSQKIHKIWRRIERKNSTPLELFFPSPTTILQFCSKPITAFSIPLLQHTYKKSKTHS
jgi:hypothetical protein